MRFEQAIAVGFRKYADFSGRASRPEFWWWILFTALVTGILNALRIGPALVLNGVAQPSGLATAWSIAVLLPTLAVTVRRLRDAGRGWGNLFWILAPVAGLVVLIVLCAQRSADPQVVPDPQPPVVPASKP